MSISFRLRPTALFVAGALLVPCSAFAQDTIPSIVPADSAAAPVPAPVASPATAPANPQPYIESLDFEEVEITQLLSMLSTQFNLPIAISGDVSGKLRGIHLKGKTAEQALNTVIQAGQLSAQKTSDGTYIISKGLPTAPIVPIVTQDGVSLPPITGSGLTGTPTTTGNSALPPLFSSNPASNTTNISTEADVPTLVEVKNGTDFKERTFNVPIHNVKASLMAFWLDPANQEVPLDVRLAKDHENQYINRDFRVQQIGGSQFSTQTQGGIASPFNVQGLGSDASTGNPYLNSNADMVEMRSNAQFGQGNNGNNNNRGNNGNNNGRGGNGRNGGGGTLQLPEGVSKIVAVDPQNALLVFGTPEGARKLADTIAFLDRPLRQVEIEAQFLSVSTSDAKTYGFDFTTSRGNFNGSSTGTATSTPAGGLQLGFFRGNFQAAIAASITSGKAKILTAPRVTAINNLTATLNQTTSTPIVLTTTNTVANNAIAQTTGQQVFYVTTTIGLEVTPTINGDDTVTVQMSPVLQTQGTPNSLGASTITSQQLQTIANVKDGETIALGGLRTTNVTIDKTKVPLIGDIPIFGKLFRSRNNRSTEAELIIFLTARIIRRAGDEDAIAPNADALNG